MTKRKTWLWLSLAALLWPAVRLPAAELDASVVPLLKRPFFYGREYFVLRSGRAKMIVQADKADLAPAFMYLLFDAEDSSQTKRKERALNFADGQGMANSALEVVLGGYAFTALGHETQTRWTTVEGIPAVEAVWWAGGLRVTERIFAVNIRNAFVRRIELSSVNLAGPEKVTLRLSLPPGAWLPCDQGLFQETNQFVLVLRGDGKHTHEAGHLTYIRPPKPPPELRPGDIIDVGPPTLSVGPLAISPGQSVSIDSLLEVHLDPSEVRQFGRRKWNLWAANVLPTIEATRKHWAAFSSIATDDALLRDIFDHARFSLPGMIADNGVMDAGIFEYGNQWVRDTSFSLEGLVLAGHFELARSGFDHVLKDMLRDDGGAMVDSKYDNPDREELDQMGELVHALKTYRDWTGDGSLLREHRSKLVAMIERPLGPKFRDSTGMVHNRREFFERTLDDGYELAYQTYVVQGLRDAADMAEPLHAQDRAERWRAEADRTLRAMLSHPTRALVEDGRLIKRRGTDGRRVKEVPGGGEADSPGKTEQIHLAEPDTTAALPIALGLVDPRSPLARKTLDELEELWNARWSGGGYERYHSSGQGDQPGAWPMMSCLVMRAQHDAGLWDRSRRTLDWLHGVQGGRTGAWFEEIPSIRSTAFTSGIVPWASGDVTLFVVRHVLGVRFEGDRLTLKPALYPHSPPLVADLRFRKGRLKLEISGAGPVQFAELDGRRIEPGPDGAIRLPPGFTGGRVVLRAKQSP